ncbi:MAG TPA: alpha/beta hydrolase [Verrucomicrobiae bacterium]|jgi:acetyl esterase/lipase|nr:alpha/beta hydrolase [Verrucomicrobiae bacterium]
MKSFPTVRSLATSICIFVLPLAISAAEPVVPDDVLFERNIEYSNPDGQHLQLNMARPKNADGLLPVVLCIHGGGFRGGTRDGHNALCLKLAQHGFVAVTITYRLAPKYQFPAAVYDTKAAVRWLRANAAKYQIDPARIGVMGDSAGGHLAQFLGVTAGVKEFEGDGGNAGESSSVACVVNEYGTSDLTKSYGKSVDAGEVLPLFLGGDLQTALPRHIQASPLNWVTPDAAPTFIMHGTDDKYVAYEQSVWMRNRLQACGVDVEMITFEGAGHGFKGADAEKAEQALIAFFEKHLKPGSK